MIDLGISLKLEDAETLLANLVEFCSIFANLDSNKDKSPAVLLGLAEVAWTTKLQMIFHNQTITQNTMDMPPRLKELMSKFNANHDYEVNK